MLLWVNQCPFYLDSCKGGKSIVDYQGRDNITFGSKKISKWAYVIGVNKDQPAKKYRRKTNNRLKLRYVTGEYYRPLFGQSEMS